MNAVLLASSYHQPGKLPGRPEDLWGEKQADQSPEQMLAVLKRFATVDETETETK